jgi:hypothetical protein
MSSSSIAAAALLLLLVIVANATEEIDVFDDVVLVPLADAGDQVSDAHFLQLYANFVVMTTSICIFPSDGIRYLQAVLMKRALNPFIDSVGKRMHSQAKSNSNLLMSFPKGHKLSPIHKRYFDALAGQSLGKRGYRFEPVGWNSEE